MKEQIEQLIEQAADQHGYALVESLVHPGANGRGGQVRVTIGSKDPALSLGSADCSKVSTQVGREIDERGLDEFFAGKYRLEVSTPGLTRKLKTELELAFGVGRNVKIRFRGAGKGKPVPDDVRGVLQAYDEQQLTVAVGDEVRDIARSDIRVVQLDLL